MHVTVMGRGGVRGSIGLTFCKGQLAYSQILFIWGKLGLYVPSGDTSYMINCTQGEVEGGCWRIVLLSWGTVSGFREIDALV